MAAERRARGSYSAGLATRESILEAAMGLIAQSGYHGFSLRDVGREVGISHPAVIYHFPSKEALLVAVIERFETGLGLVGVSVDDSADSIVEHGVLPEDLAQMGLTLMRLAKHPEAHALIAVDCALAVEAASESHPAHTHYATRFAALRGFLVDQLSALSADGVIRSGLAVDTLADGLVRGWYGIAVQTRYAATPDARLYPISTYLAASARLLELSPQNVMLIAARIPEDLGDIFARTMRIYTEMAS